MKIQFILPGAGTDPVGGFKVVYEYANGLVQRGYEVVIVHAALRLADADSMVRVCKLGRYWIHKVRGTIGPGSWFALDPRVRIQWVYSPDSRSVGDADATFATSWQTAEWVAQYSRSKGEKYYLVQDLETWSGSLKRIVSTFRLGLRTIVISRWLQDELKAYGNNAFYLPNGLDWDAFRIETQPENRTGQSIGFLVHEDERKGSRDALEAIERVRAKRAVARVHAFGAMARPEWLPEHVTYQHRPTARSLQDFYNSLDIFISMSRQEGWGLTPCEAMMCGCAVVVSDVGGHREFAVDRETALIVNPVDVEAASECVVELLDMPLFRQQLAHRGRRYLKRFNWDASVRRLEDILVDNEPRAAFTREADIQS